MARPARSSAARPAAADSTASRSPASRSAASGAGRSRRADRSAAARARGQRTGPDDGREVELVVGPPAHGGHCVARLDGRVVFVRHALPGERVVARLAETGAKATFWRADAVGVLDASPDRVPSPWPQAGPGGIGGGELGHVSLAGQRSWKAQVLAEQLRRLAHLDLTPTVEAAPGDDERGGLGYRTRIDLVTDDEGRAGMHRYRSHDVVPLAAMPLATTEVADLAEQESVFSRRWAPGVRLELVAPADGSAPLLLANGVPWHHGRADNRPNTRRSVAETVRAAGADYVYRVAAGGFWQVHRAAPALLVETVLAALGPLDGARVLDLYAGAGLFTLPLARAVGPTGRVIAVEGDPGAARDARRNAHGLGTVELLQGEVKATLGGRDAAAGSPAAADDRPSHGAAGPSHGAAGPSHGAAGPSGATDRPGRPIERADAVVLDPPRVGAGREVVHEIARRRPERVVYVACDPAALARDVAFFADAGYRLAGVRALDLFPMTHHMECVATIERA